MFQLIHLFILIHEMSETLIIAYSNLYVVPFHISHIIKTNKIVQNDKVYRLTQLCVCYLCFSGTGWKR